MQIYKAVKRITKAIFGECELFEDVDKDSGKMEQRQIRIFVQ